MSKDPFYEDPAADQTPAEIEEFLKSRSAGDEVAIHNSQGGMGLLEIKIAKVTEIRPRGRMRTDIAAPYGRNSWFAKSGKNCDAPTGQSRLVIPTEEVRRYAEERRYALDRRPLDTEKFRRAIEQAKEQEAKGF